MEITVIQVCYVLFRIMYYMQIGIFRFLVDVDRDDKNDGFHLSCYYGNVGYWE